MPFTRPHRRIRPPGQIISPLDVPYTLLTSALALSVALLLSVILPERLWTTALIFTVLFAYLFTSAHKDAQRVVCSILSLQTCAVLGVSAIPGGFEGLVLGKECFFAQIGRGLRVRRRHFIPAGIRRPPVVLVSPEASVMWQDRSGYVPLEEPGEILGALSVVLHGSNVSIDIVFGNSPRTGKKILATRIMSSEGSVHSWDASIFRQASPFNRAALQPISSPADKPASA